MARAFRSFVIIAVVIGVVSAVLGTIARNISEETAEEQMSSAAYKLEALCWRELSRERTRLASWYEEAKWVKRCMEKRFAVQEQSQ